MVTYPLQVAIIGFGSITEQPKAEIGMIGVDIPEEDYGKVSTLNSLINYLVEKQK